MTQAKPIKATLADFKIIRGRKCAQFVFELPLEAADEALTALGGLPRPDAERWFGIVALDMSKPASERPSESEKARTPFRDLPPAQQAAMRCNEPDFRRFLAQREKFKGVLMLDTEMAADCVREICDVHSRSHLNDQPAAAARWRALDTEYFAWQRGAR
jgi:hypothetical protein